MCRYGSILQEVIRQPQTELSDGMLSSALAANDEVRRALMMYEDLVQEDDAAAGGNPQQGAWRGVRAYIYSNC